MEPDREGASTDTPTTSRACASDASVESTGVVPHATEHASTHTTPDPPEERSDPNCTSQR